MPDGRARGACALRVAYTITGNRATAEDVVSEAFLKVYRRIDQFQCGRRFEPWFLRIVANEALQAMRKVRRTERRQPLLGRRETRPPDPVEIAETNEVRRKVLAAVATLSPNERAAIVLRYLLDLDEKAVAKTLGWPLGTVKARLHRGRAHLRGRLEIDLRATLPAQEQAG